MQKIDIKSMNFNELNFYITNLSWRSFHAKQIFVWLSKGILSFNKMTNLSLELRQTLYKECEIKTVKISKKQISKDGTVKYLFQLSDGQKIESVLMKYNHGYTLCISTQIGCKMGCIFCATGKSGFSRNLTASEMLSQVQIASEDSNQKISNVVLMGMGEPFDNYQNTLKFLEIITDENGMNIGKRHVSVSTCGIVDKIYDLIKKNLKLSLSVSLHAPNDDIRNKILKINKKNPINALLTACKSYSQNARKRVTFVYTMIKNLNDKDEHAKELAQKIKDISCHLNLIPLNPIKEEKLEKSTPERMKKFCEILIKNNINVTIRRTLGDDINASCGQLKLNKLKF